MPEPSRPATDAVIAFKNGDSHSPHEIHSRQDSMMKPGFLHHLSSDHEGFVLNEIIREEVLHEVYTAIETLPYQCRRIFKMCYVEGLNNLEIAERSHLSVHTVKNHKIRAIGLLRLKFLEGCL